MRKYTIAPVYKIESAWPRQDFRILVIYGDAGAYDIPFNPTLWGFLRALWYALRDHLSMYHVVEAEAVNRWTRPDEKGGGHE